LPHQLVLVGPGASIGLSSWHFDLAFLSAQGMNADGLWNSQDDISNFQRDICGRSSRSVFCLDDSKLDQSAPSFLLPWKAVETLVTTADYGQLERCGVRINRRKWIYAAGQLPG
jgi:DeoR/GlpR family transcriptional regulator of sugar metabolism